MIRSFDLTSSGPSAADGLYDDSPGADAPQMVGRWDSSTYNSAYMFHLGMLMLVPLLFETVVQFNMGKALYEAAHMIGSLSFIFYPFSMQVTDYVRPSDGLHFVARPRTPWYTWRGTPGVCM